MDNREYLASMGVEDEAVIKRCLAAMGKYGENHWWEEQKSNPRKFAYFQVKEPLMLCEDFSIYRNALSDLIGRKIYTHEMGLNNDKLIEEAEQAYTKGYVLSNQERHQHINESLQSLADYAERNNKELNIIERVEDNKNN